MTLIIKQSCRNNIHNTPMNVYEFAININQGRFRQIVRNGNSTLIAPEQTDGDSILTGNQDNFATTEGVLVVVDKNGPRS